MEARAVTHPSADALQAFALGKMDDAAAEVVVNHLDACAECRRAVSALSGDDFLHRLRQAHGRSATPAPAKVMPAVAPPAQPAPSQAAVPNVPPELAANPGYEIVRELGRGGMGVVYLAKNKLMDRLEVLKVVNRALLDRPGAVERFLREIRAAAKLSHPNVVPAYSALQLGALLVFAMEYVEGEDLAKVVAARGPLPVVHACYYAQQAALGLQHAFEKGMVHRDIKPQNLILAREGKKHLVKILDFGLAKATREKGEDTGLTGEGKMLGTPDYIAPEQTLDAAKSDIRADIYSLGCTLYYLLTGAPPFKGKSLYEVLQAHHTVQAKPLNLVRPDVPAELAAVVAKMMAKEPGRRYQKPIEAAQALAPFIKPGAKATPDGPSPKAAAEDCSVARDTSISPAGAGETAVPDRPAAPAPESPPVVAWDTLTAGRHLSRAPKAAVRKRRPRPAKPMPRKIWLIGGAVAAVCVLLLGLVGLWAAGVFKVKTADGVLVVQVNEPNAEVFVDGERVTVSWNGGGKTAEIHVKPGTRKVEVKKDGFSADGEELTFKDGDREIFTARLLPKQDVAQAGRPPDKPPDANPGAPPGPAIAKPGPPAEPPETARLPPDKQQKATAAVERGVALLRGTQNADGSWSGEGHLVGTTALPGLTLLECGIPADDPAVQRAAVFVRKGVPNLAATYELALAILFLDQLGDPADEPLIQSMGVRLMGGQGRDGGWSYNCPSISESEARWLTNLIQHPDQNKPKDPDAKPEKRTVKDLPKEIQDQLASLNSLSPPTGTNDNSNTQFAALGLWAARRHGIPVDKALERLDQRFRTTQHADGGWGYISMAGLPGPATTGGVMDNSTATMTCAGVTCLAVARGPKAEAAVESGKATDLSNDAVLTKGLAALGRAVEAPVGQDGQGPSAGGKTFYFLWSLERVGVLFDQDKIGGRDWYDWGADILIANQNADGSWHGEYPPVVDTCFALLFLKRANLAEDLSKKLHRSARIDKPAEPAANEFVSLFDGKDLSEWSIDGGFQRQWKVEGDAIVGQVGDSEPTTHMLSTKKYADFTLRLEYMVDPGGRGGIDLRAVVGEQMPLSQPGTFWYAHPAFELSDSAKYPDVPSGATHWVKDDRMTCKPDEDLQLAAGSWHSLEITVRGDACIGLLDGKKVVDVHLDPKAGGAAGAALNRAKGRIGLQAHTGTMRFRKIEIKELK